MHPEGQTCSRPLCGICTDMRHSPRPWKCIPVFLSFVGLVPTFPSAQQPACSHQRTSGERVRVHGWLPSSPLWPEKTLGEEFRNWRGRIRESVRRQGRASAFTDPVKDGVWDLSYTKHSYTQMHALAHKHIPSYSAAMVLVSISWLRAADSATEGSKELTREKAENPGSAAIGKNVLLPFSVSDTLFIIKFQKGTRWLAMMGSCTSPLTRGRQDTFINSPSSLNCIVLQLFWYLDRHN